MKNFHQNISRRDFIKTTAATTLTAASYTLSATSNATEDKIVPQKSKFMILGSGAADLIPSPFCTCDVCRRSRELGGKNLRFRAGYQIDDSIRIEWGPDANAQFLKFDLKPWLIKHIFITHTHDDHFQPTDFWLRSVTAKNSEIITKLYGNKQVIEAVRKIVGNNWKSHFLEPITMVPGQTVEIPEKQMKVTALLANHMATEQALLYIFATPTWKLFISHDTTIYPESTWELLKDAQIDVFVPDCTWGPVRREDGHMGAPNVVDVVKRMRSIGALKEKCKIIPSHFTHFGGFVHSEFEEYMKPLGMEPAYDGKIVELPLN